VNQTRKAVKANENIRQTKTIPLTVRNEDGKGSPRRCSMTTSSWRKGCNVECKMSWRQGCTVEARMATWRRGAARTRREGGNREGGK